MKELAPETGPAVIDAAFVAKQLAVERDITMKVARYGVRTPTAPNLTALTEDLERAAYMPVDPSAEADLTGIYYQWKAQVEEAREYFYG